jgi:hypothetical protein
MGWFIEWLVLNYLMNPKLFWFCSCVVAQPVDWMLPAALAAHRFEFPRRAKPMTNGENSVFG